jgi:hypothetical protein
MSEIDPEEAFAQGRAVFDGFVRGDAMIGLVADVPGTLRTMLDALWSAARAGHAPAYRTLAECHLAALRTLGAFDGVDPADADARPWSDDARAIADDNPSLQATLRAFAEAGRLGDREATLQLARLSCHSTEANQRRALASLAALADPSPAELYQRGLVHHWLGELEAAHARHVDAADAGSSDAMFELHIIYAQGLGVPADPVASRAWLDRAAAADHPRALYNLGAAHASGSEGAVDMAKAAAYYTPALQTGGGLE